MNPQKKTIISVFLVYAILQLVLLLIIHVPYSSDSLQYFNLARECLARQTHYPGSHNLYDAYIVAPFFINTIRLILSLVNHPISLSAFNILLNLLQMFLLYHISRKVFDKPGRKDVVWLCNSD